MKKKMKNQLPPQPDYDDESLWKETIKSTKKTSHNKMEYTKPVEIQEIHPSIDLRDVYTGNILENLEFDNIANIDNNTAKKFKREEFKIESTLDLHGCTEDTAYKKVFNFVKKAYISNQRCILIITGKGLPKDNDNNFFATKGLLKEKVPQWLNSAELRALILAIKHPTAKNGGEGALYIFLRRHR